MTANQEVWSARLPNGEVRSGTLEQLGEAFRAGHVGQGTLVCAAGSSQWMRLADILAAPAAGVAGPHAAQVRAAASSVPAPAPAPSAAPAPPSAFPSVNANGEQWQVRLATGQIRSGTRQQLDEAFRAGHLSEDLLVLPSGASSWVTLGTVLGRSVPPPAPAPAPVLPLQPPAPVAAHAPVPAHVPAPAPTPSVTPAVPAGGELWQVRLADGQVRSGTRQQLEEAFRAGHLDPNALVLAAGASEWAPLAVLAARLSTAPAQPTGGPVDPAAEAPPQPTSQAPVPSAVAEEARPEPHAAAAASEPRWQLQVTDEQLDAVVQAGLLGDDAPVLAIGTDQWVRLADLRRARQGDPT